VRLKIAVAAATAAFIALGAQVAVASVPTVLIAHRGLSDAAQNKYGIPEHSQKAYLWAIGQGAKVVDFDVQWTKPRTGYPDGELVIMHNTSLNETTNVSDSKTQYVKDWRLSDIKKLWLELPRDLDGNGNDDNTDQHPLSLNQGLDLIKPKTVDGTPVQITLESKGHWTLDRVKKLYTVINGKGMKNRVIFHSFNLDHVKWSKTAGFPLRGYIVGSKSSDPIPTPATAKSYGSYIFMPLERLTATQAEAYQAAGIKVAVWTLDNTAEYDRAIAEHADIWACNDIAEAREYLEGLT